MVAAVEGEQFVAGSVGLARAYRVEPNRLVQLTRDDSLLQEAIDSGASAEEVAAFCRSRLMPMRVLCRKLDGTWRTSHPSWQPTASSLDGALGFVIASEYVFRDVNDAVLGDWVRSALREADLEGATATLWDRCREQARQMATAHWTLSSDPEAVALGEYDRKAAIVLLRCGRAPSGGT